MKHLKLILLSSSMLLVVASRALAGQMPEVDPQKAAEILIFGLNPVAWASIIAGAGMLVIWVLKLTLLARLTGKALGWTASVLVGLVAGLGVIQQNGLGAWGSALGTAFLSGLEAVTSWDLWKLTKIGQKMDALKTKREEAAIAKHAMKKLAQLSTEKA